MPAIQKIAQGGTYDPGTLELLSSILDDIWMEVGDVFSARAEAGEARNAIAKCLLYHSVAGLTDRNALKALALQTLRQEYRKVSI